MDDVVIEGAPVSGLTLLLIVQQLDRVHNGIVSVELHGDQV